jgi:hypothetical protein
MPKSRGRRPRKPTCKVSRKQQRSLEKDLASVRSHLGVMIRADDAELRGDAAGALALMESKPIGPDGRAFWRPWRLRHLQQLVDYRPHLPRWVTSRWILEQAAQALPTQGRRTAVLEALDLTVDLRGGLHRLPGVDEVDARCKVIDHDWVFRQTYLYELGALTSFLTSAASPDLLAGADRIVEWTQAPMTGLRLVHSAPKTVSWHDLGSGDHIDVPNIGCAARLRPGDHVIGRVVPSDEGRMFETTPLPVSERIAREVALQPDHWIAALRRAMRGGGRTSVRTHGFDFAIATDVSAEVWIGAVLGRDPASLEPEVALASIARATLRLARQTTAGGNEPGGVDPWPCLGAAILQPGVTAAVDGAMSAEDAETMGVLSARLAEPAARVCQVLSEDHRAAA